MGKHKRRLDLAKRLNRHLVLLTSLAGVYVPAAFGFEWIARPNLTMSELFDDNLNLSQTAKQAGAVSEVTPGFYLKGVSPWSNVNLNYRLQGLYNAQADDAVTVNHQLQFNSTLQPVQNTLYLDTSASISQQNASNSFIATDNVSGRSREQNENFNISPYFTPHFGQYATGLLKGGYARSFFNETNSGGDTTTISNSISNSETISKQVGLTSGTYFNVISWGLNYSGQNQQTSANSTSSAGDTRFESYNANGRYFINQNWNLFAQGGYENNYFQSVSNSNALKNGFDYTGGVQWKPSLWYSMEVGLGNNSHATIQYNPSNNLTSHVTYNYKTVGLNLGSTWDAALNYTTQRSRWSLGYTQQTQTTQQLLVQQTQQFYTGLIQQSDGQLVSVKNLPYLVSLPTLVNDVLISKTGNISFSYTLGKSTYNLNAYNTRRTYELSQEQDTLYGVTGGWQWQFEPRWNYYLQPVWQKTNSNVSTSNTDLYQVSTGVTRSIPVNWGKPMSLNTTLDLRHIEETSAAANSSYIENRATASFFVQY